MKKPWIFIAIGAATAASGTSPKVDDNRLAMLSGVKAKLSHIKKSDLLTMMRTSDCRCISKTRSSINSSSSSISSNQQG
jgi:hypothetical protein